MKVFLKKVMILFMWYPLRILIKVLPLRLDYLIGVAGGHVLFSISNEKRKLMAAELSLVFPHKSIDEIKGIIKGSFINYCISELEVLFYPIMNRDFIRRTVTIEGREHLDNALTKGRGVLLFQAHFGAFQVVMPAIGYSGYKMSQISASASEWKGQNSSGIQKKGFDIKAEHEYALPVQHIAVKASLRPVFKALNRN